MKQSLIITVILLFILPALVYAQTGGSYDLSWSTIVGGGTSRGDSYILESTIGQPGIGSMNGGNYTLVGGFWGEEGPVGPPPGGNDVYLPVILRE